MSGTGTLAPLDRFGVAYFTYHMDATRAHMSTAAAGLAASDPCLVAQADRLVQRVLRAPRLVRPGPDIIAEAPAYTGPYTLSVHALPASSQPYAVAVLVQPRPAQCGESELLQPLTPRERQVAHLIARGHGTKQIAAALGISAHTARHHTERVFAKLGVGSRASIGALLGAAVGTSSHGPDRAHEATVGDVPAA